MLPMRGCFLKRGDSGNSLRKEEVSGRIGDVRKKILE